MRGLYRTSSSAICVDSFRAWPWISLLLLCGMMWFLPLSHVVNTLEFNLRPPFSVPEEGEAEKAKTSATDEIIHKALEAAGCDKGYSSLGQNCSLLKETIGLMDTHEIDQGKKKHAGDEEEEKFPWNRDPDIIPELKANCWCPAQFEASQVAYANRVCASGVNRLIRGLSKDTSLGVPYSDPHDPMMGTNGRLKEIAQNITQRKVYTQRKDVFDRYNGFITHRTSYLLFIFGLLLLIPSLVWWKLSSSIWCGLSIDKTIDILQRAHSYEPDARGKIYQDISRETSAEAMSSGKTAKLFLICKMLVCCASLAVLISMYHLLQPHANTLAAELEELSEIAKLYPFQNDFIFHCFFTIRQMQNAHDYRVQCLPSFPFHVGVNWSRNTDPHYQLDVARRVVLIYGTLFQVVSAFFILHATVNFCGILEWMWKLYIDRNHFASSGKPGNIGFSEDIRFFLHSAHEQLGHVVSRELAEGLRLTQNKAKHASLFSEPGGYGDVEDNF